MVVYLFSNKITIQKIKSTTWKKQKTTHEVVIVLEKGSYLPTQTFQAYCNKIFKLVASCTSQKVQMPSFL
jgi:hypothetical protein